MPRIAKGGKFIFGWSRVSDDGTFVVPDQARREYGLKQGAMVVLIPGSKTSGGFGISPRNLLERSRLSSILDFNPEPADFRVGGGKAVEFKGRPCCLTSIEGDGLKIIPGILALFGVRPGDRLLAIRSSDIAIGMAVRGPLIAEAVRHPEIETY